MRGRLGSMAPVTKRTCVDARQDGRHAPGLDLRQVEQVGRPGAPVVPRLRGTSPESRADVPSRAARVARRAGRCPSAASSAACAARARRCRRTPIFSRSASRSICADRRTANPRPAITSAADRIIVIRIERPVTRWASADFRSIAAWLSWSRRSTSARRVSNLRLDALEVVGVAHRRAGSTRRAPGESRR